MRCLLDISDGYLDDLTMDRLVVPERRLAGEGALAELKRQKL
jgi:hypothetical protein